MTNTELNFFATKQFEEIVKRICIYDLQTRSAFLDSYIDLLKDYKKQIENINSYNAVKNEGNLFIDDHN